MTDDEVRRGLFYMSSTWEEATLGDGALQMWRNRLRRLESFEYFIEAINNLGDVYRRWPAWADVLSSYQAVVRDNPTFALESAETFLTPAENTLRIKEIDACRGRPRRKPF